MHKNAKYLSISLGFPIKQLEKFMLGPIGSEIMSIFRLLSPDEIDNYIVDRKVSRIEGTLTATGEELAHDSSKQFYKKAPHENPAQEEDINVEQQAKIIPLHPQQEQKEQPQRESKATKLHSEQENNGNLSSLGILSAGDIRRQEEKRLKEEKSKKDSATVFLLKEREKMRTSKKRITEQVAMKTYQMNAAIDLTQLEEDYEEEQNGGIDHKGILVDKKQF